MERRPHDQHEQQSIELLLRRIAALVAERQELRARGLPERELEANRLEIVACQRELNHALISVYGRQAA